MLLQNAADCFTEGVIALLCLPTLECSVEFWIKAKGNFLTRHERNPKKTDKLTYSLPARCVFPVDDSDSTESLSSITDGVVKCQ